MSARRIVALATLLFLPVLLPLTAGADTWELANGDRLTGQLIREDGTFIELDHAQLGRIKLPRSAIRAAALAKNAAAPAPGKAIAVKAAVPRWKRQVDVGYSQQSGAKEKQDLSIRFQVDGKRGGNTYRATAKLLQTEADKRQVTDRREADFRWRHDIDKRLFTQTLTTYVEDDVRRVDLSLEQQVGGGLRLLDSSRHKVNIGLGAVLQYLDRADAAEQTAVLGSFFQDYAYEMNSRLKLTQESTVMVSDKGALNVRPGTINAPTSDGSYRVKFVTGMQSKVTDRMSLNVRFEYDYDRSVLDEDLRADQRLTTSLGYLW